MKNSGVWEIVKNDLILKNKINFKIKELGDHQLINEGTCESL